MMLKEEVLNSVAVLGSLPELLVVIARNNLTRTIIDRILFRKLTRANCMASIEKVLKMQRLKLPNDRIP